MLFVILGMHKSGTTLVAEIMQRSGIDMGDFDLDVDYDRGNQFERAETQRVNKWLLGCSDAWSLDVVEPLDVRRMSSRQRAELQRAADALSAGSEDRGFKDPRTCLTYDAWRQVLPEHKVIFVYRDPREVWRHYVARGTSRFGVRRAYRGWKALHAWYAYNLAALEAVTAGSGETLVIHYGDLMREDRLFARLEGFVGRPLHDSRRRDLYRARNDGGALYHLEVSGHRRLGRDVEALWRRLESVGR